MNLLDGAHKLSSAAAKCQRGSSSCISPEVLDKSEDKKRTSRKLAQ